MTTNEYQLQVIGIDDYFVSLNITNGNLAAVTFQEIKLLDSDRQRDMADRVYTEREDKIILQFTHYFKSPHNNWDIKFDWPKKTTFQHRVLNYLQTIPLGTTKTYGKIAKHLNTSARAVGNACRHNPYPIVIPCHRVVAQNSIGGYDGDRNLKSDDFSGRLAIKYFLLKHERVAYD